MNPAPVGVTKLPANHESPGPFCVAVIYDTPLARERATRIHSDILKHVDSLEFESHCWAFAELQNGPAADRSAGIAAGAALVIFATESRLDLPLQVRAWIERWLSKLDSRERALVLVSGIVAGDDASVLPARRYLEHVAEEARMAFFATSFPLPQAKAYSLLDELMARAEYKSLILEEMHQGRPPSHWGLNE